jgi:hypothetical protein
MPKGLLAGLSRSQPISDEVEVAVLLLVQFAEPPDELSLELTAGAAAMALTLTLAIDKLAPRMKNLKSE